MLKLKLQLSIDKLKGGFSSLNEYQLKKIKGGLKEVIENTNCTNVDCHESNTQCAHGNCV